MAFELQIANLRWKRPAPAQPRPAAFLPTSRIELAGELNERSSERVADRIDAELAVGSRAILISLDHVTVPHWGALCHLVTKIQSVRKRGYDVRIARPNAAIRLLLGTIVLGDPSWFEAEEA
jgi:hypothetical protein